MARKIRLTRPELKRERDALARYERYLPMLKLKQQQLQITVREVVQQIRVAEQALVDSAATRLYSPTVQASTCAVWPLPRR